MKDDYICLALIMHLVITIAVVVDWRMNLLNEVEVLTTRLSEDIIGPPIKQGAQIHQPSFPSVDQCFFVR